MQSLSGHTTAVEAVRFSPTEELVCAGSAAGAVKVWDLEAARIVRTLTGHRAGIKALDFHPYGDFLATGSSDTNIKVNICSAVSCSNIHRPITGSAYSSWQAGISS